MKINDEGTSNAAHWHERAMKAESRLAEAEALAKELRIRYHAAGRRPEECYEMSLIDAFLAPDSADDDLTTCLCGY